MTHPYRGKSTASAECQLVVSELHRARLVLVLLVGLIVFLLLLFGLGMQSAGWTFLWSPGAFLLVAVAIVSMLTLSIPHHGEMSRSGLVLQFLYGKRTASLNDLRKARRIILNPGIDGKDGLILVVLTARCIATRICLIALSGRISRGDDPWRADSYDTAVDRALLKLDSSQGCE